MSVLPLSPTQISRLRRRMTKAGYHGLTRLDHESREIASMALFLSNETLDRVEVGGLIDVPRLRGLAHPTGTGRPPMSASCKATG